MKSVATIGCVVALVIGGLLFLAVLVIPTPPDPAKGVEPTERMSPDARIEGAGPAPIQELDPAEPYTPPPPSTEFEVKVDSCSGSRDYVSVEGHVRNTGTTTVNFVTLELRYEDGEGQVVDTGTTYAVGSELLRPGESSRYRGLSRARGVRRCRAQIQDWRVAE